MILAYGIHAPRNRREPLESPQLENLQKMTRNKLLDIEIAEVGEEEIDAHFHLLPDSYFVNTSKEEIALHVRMINRLLYEINHADSVGSLKPIIEWTPDIENGLSEVNVVTWDRAGLFHKLSGALNVAGYNILGARAISRTDNIAIDTFFVQEREDGHRPNSETVFADALNAALISNNDLYPKILDIFRSQSSRNSKVGENQIAHSFHPKVEIYQALSGKNAIIETQAPDTPGLLYQIAHKLHQKGYDITSANISTKQGIAIDTIHFRSALPNRILTREELLTLNKQIAQTVAETCPFLKG